MVNNPNRTTAPRHEELGYWLVLKRIPGLGPRRFAELLALEKSLSNCFNGGEPRKAFLDWCAQNKIGEFTLDWQGVEKDLAWAANSSHHIITLEDDDYPLLLKEIAAPPPLLFVKGNKALLKSPQLAMVGSRIPSSEGRKNAHEFAAALAKLGFTITSGLALGIDGASHEGALSVGGNTIAVLGSGVDICYPAKHRNLGLSICEQGALVSEFGLGVQAQASHFPQRNRIISGLSLGVLVVESALKSGSLITANYALNQGREIFALPGSIHNPMAKGCLQLIRQGAKCVDTIEHIIEEISHLSLIVKPNKECLNNSASKKPFREELSSENYQFLAHLSTVCTPIDTVVDRTGLTVTEVSSKLFQLEMEGKVASVPGGYIRVEQVDRL